MNPANLSRRKMSEVTNTLLPDNAYRKTNTYNSIHLKSTLYEERTEKILSVRKNKRSGRKQKVGDETTETNHFDYNSYEAYDEVWAPGKPDHLKLVRQNDEVSDRTYLIKGASAKVKNIHYEKEFVEGENKNDIYVVETAELSPGEVVHKNNDAFKGKNIVERRRVTTGSMMNSRNSS